LESITKSKITHEKINEMVKHAFGNSVKSEIITELTDGCFNSAYMLTLTNGLKTVLKVSPLKDLLVMRYEKNVMETEVHVLNRIRSLGDIPVPKVLYYDQSEKIIKNDFFFMEFVEGVPLNKLQSELTKKQNIEISLELSSYVTRMHSIQCSHFGHILQEDKKFKTWEEAFLFMIKELLDYAIDAKVLLPYSYDKIYNMVYEKRSVLNLVKKPSLIHKDLWQGNIFVDPKTMKTTGIVDCERAIYGDTLLELVCGFLLDDENFMKSYTGGVALEKDEKIRIVLYQIYLYLIMVIECSYRQYSDESSSEWANTQLQVALTDLQKYNI